MSTITTVPRAAALPEVSNPPETPARRAWACIPNTFLAWLRGFAWRVLDMGTEFDTLD